MPTLRPLLLPLLLVAAAALAPAQTSNAPVQGYTPPGPPDGWQWGQFTNAQKAKLRFGFAPSANPKGTLVFFGGYTEFAEKYFETMHDFQKLGYAVWFLDWRGQGGSDRYLADRQKAVLEDLGNDAADAWQFLSQHVKSPKEQTCIISHSLGGLITLRLLHDHPEAAACAVFSSPTIELGLVAPFPYWLLRARTNWALRLGWRYEYVGTGGPWQDGLPAQLMAATLTSSQARQPMTAYWFRTKPELQLGSVTYSWTDAFLNSSILVLGEEYLQAIKTPILIGSAGLDTLASLPAHRRMQEKIPGAKLVYYAGAKHEMFLEEDSLRSAWLKEMQQFFAAQLKSQLQRQ